jgi:phenylacetate-CoA ligase
MAIAQTIYLRMPAWAQHVAVTAYGAYWKRLRFGQHYYAAVAEFSERDRFSRAQWQDWQDRTLADLLTNAAENVPYYREHWTPQQKLAARAGRLEELPVLSKDPVRRNVRAFVETSAKKFKEFTFFTSGSTGTPIASIFTLPEIQASMAVREVRSAGWASVSFKMPRATFSGRLVVSPDQFGSSLHRYNFVERQVYFSAFHLNPETTATYLRALEQHKVVWGTGYAVSWYLLAMYALKQNLRVPQLQAVITTAEKVTVQMREVIERAFSCRVFEEYSTVDNIIFASECESGRLHVSPDVGMIEILKQDGSRCQPGEVGEVVATAIMRRHHGLIRYRLGDYAKWATGDCPCGRGMPVIEEIMGRTMDVLVTPDGRHVWHLEKIFNNLPNIVQAQVIQEAKDRVRIRVVPDVGFGKVESEELLRRASARLGPQVRIEIDEVDAIPRTKAGKYRMVVALESDPAIAGKTN